MAQTQAASAASATQAAAPAPRQGTREGLDIDAKNGPSLDYASRLRDADLKGGTIVLRSRGTSYAGGAEPGAISVGETWRVMTGAPLPPPAPFALRLIRRATT